LTAFFVSFFSEIEWFLMLEPEMSELAHAPPPSATNSATAAMIVAGCSRRFTYVLPVG
jgi:hypothetical protein